MKTNLLKSSLIVFLSLSTFGCTATAKAEQQSLSPSIVKVQKIPHGWELLVDGKPYIVKGVSYSPTPVGESPHESTWRDWMIADDDHDGIIDAPYQSWVDKNKNNKQDSDEKPIGDFQLLKDMGCNTIRVYHHASTNPAVQRVNKGTSALLYNHAPNKKLLRDLFTRFGIRVMMGDFLGAYTIASGADWNTGTDYRDPQQQQNMLRSIEDMVKEFKDEPYLLMWTLGNENNLPQFTHTNANQFPEDYAKFVNNVARRIHELDPNHPVVLCNGDVEFLDVYKTYAPDIDIIGLNVYRNDSFADVWAKAFRMYDKPIVFTEYGTQHMQFTNGELDENFQAQIAKTQWLDILNHTYAGNAPTTACIGAFVFEWLDEWWHDGKPYEHNLGENDWNNEWYGIAAQGDGTQPLIRQLRKSYFTFQSLWREN